MRHSLSKELMFNDAKRVGDNKWGWKNKDMLLGPLQYVQLYIAQYSFCTKRILSSECGN